MIKRLKSIYSREMFFPTFLGIFINPFYLARAGLSNVMTSFAPMLSGRLLDVGCGTKPYRSLFVVDEYIGLDIDSEATSNRGIADKTYDGGDFPFPDADFDAVLCNQVLEHVFNPDEFLGEIKRVLRPGGKLLLTVPFVWDEHEQPFDYARYSSFGLRALLEKHGFEIVEQRKSTDDIRVIFQLLNAYIYKKTVTKIGWLNLLLVMLFMAPFNILGEILSIVTPRNPDLYLDNILLAKKRSHMDNEN